MLGHAWMQFFLFIIFIIILIPLLGSYMVNIFTDCRTFMSPLLGWLERLCYRMGGVNEKVEMTWKTYAKTLIFFNFLGFLTLFSLHLMQEYLPLNPQHLPAPSWSLAFNTTISFVTNTNWQAYSGETTLSYFTQMLGLTVQNFLSAATGMVVLVAFIRGFTRKGMETIGNFWNDLIRTTIYILLPLSILLAVALVGEGVIQTFSPYVEITTLENGKQTIPLGPVASQVAIKQLGTNGGGFFNANSAHPFENPTPFSNLLELLAIILIPAASVYMYGCLINSKKHGWLLLSVMAFLFLGGLAVSIYSETISNPVVNAYPLLEGKETRFGVSDSVIWAGLTSATANGSVNSMLSSLTPLAGGVAMFNIMIGEIIFGGIGVGLCSMIMFVLLTVFLCGLMVGRTPEYLGKKIEKKEMQWVIIAILMPSVLILIGSGTSIILPEALSSIANQGPHGLTEILYAFSSAAGTNGSAFAGLNANTNYFNLVLGVVMLIARITIIIASLAIAGQLAKKKITPPSIGTFSTNTLLFVLLLVCVIMIESALTFFPALALGPIVEQLLMIEGQTF